MDQEQYQDRIAQLPMLAEMAGESRRNVAELLLKTGAVHAHDNSDILIRRDGLGGDIGFILLDGRVRIDREKGDPLMLDAPAVLGEMHQLNPGAHRTADVIAEGPVTALKFSWRKLYTDAREELRQAEVDSLMTGIERLVLRRFHEQDLLDLPLLRGLPDELKLRVCLVLHWVSTPFELEAGGVLFREQDMCGDTGFLITHGELDITMSGQRSAHMAAPDICGIMLRFAPELRWTATARATTPLQGKRFAWLVLRDALEQRILPDEQHKFQQALEAWAENHFIH